MKAALADDSNTTVGLIMLKKLDERTGYVYYVAVSSRFRRRRVGSRLLDEALKYFAGVGADIVFASVSEDNVESNALFSSRGFRPTDFGEVSRMYGRVHAADMYRRMLIVRGGRTHQDERTTIRNGNRRRSIRKGRSVTNTPEPRYLLIATLLFHASNLSRSSSFRSDVNSSRSSGFTLTLYSFRGTKMSRFLPRRMACWISIHLS